MFNLLFSKAAAKTTAQTHLLAAAKKIGGFMSNNVRPVPPSFGHKALTAFISASLCLSLAPAQAFAVDDSTTDTTATTSEAPAQPAPASTTDTPATPASELSDKLRPLLLLLQFLLLLQLLLLLRLPQIQSVQPIG